MRFKKDSIDIVKKIIKNKKINYIFNNLGKDISENQNELIDQITLIFMSEFDLPYEDEDKVRFLVKLGFFTGK